MQAGDLVRVNKQCDAGGLWGRVGVVMDIGQYCRSPLREHDDGMRANVMMGGQLRRFMCTSLEVVNERR